MNRLDLLSRGSHKAGLLFSWVHFYFSCSEYLYHSFLCTVKRYNAGCIPTVGNHGNVGGGVSQNTPSVATFSGGLPSSPCVLSFWVFGGTAAVKCHREPTAPFVFWLFKVFPYFWSVGSRGNLDTQIILLKTLLPLKCIFIFISGCWRHLTNEQEGLTWSQQWLSDFEVTPVR